MKKQRSEMEETEKSYQLPLDFVPITLQRIFDAAWQAFIVEGKPPAQENDGGWCCRYLTSDGKKCGVGLTLPDGHPAQRSTEMASQLALCYPKLFSMDGHPKELDTLQNKLHDDLCVNGRWSVEGGLEAVYRSVASEHHLTIPGERP